MNKSIEKQDIIVKQAQVTTQLNHIKSALCGTEELIDCLKDRLYSVLRVSTPIEKENKAEPSETFVPLAEDLFIFYEKICKNNNDLSTMLDLIEL